MEAGACPSQKKGATQENRDCFTDVGGREGEEKGDSF